ncbi:MAG TPA: hypothetical protein VFH54_17645, partial [Mycobacteriales bacterium]|nr:hypothetical protein [Mycobacteriales bacterium]
RLARRDIDVTAESAFCSNRAVDVFGLRLFAASDIRWTKARTSGKAIAPKTHMRSRRVRNTHTRAVYPDADRLNRCAGRAM